MDAYIQLINALIEPFMTVIICGIICFAFIAGFRMGRKTNGGDTSLKVSMIKNEDKDALDTEDIFSEQVNDEGLANPADRINTL
jgi:hypothetical protein